VRLGDLARNGPRARWEVVGLDLGPICLHRKERLVKRLGLQDRVEIRAEIEVSRQHPDRHRLPLRLTRRSGDEGHQDDEDRDPFHAAEPRHDADRAQLAR
jgi:hypothetical protein